jgi:hypothetical protein
MWHLSSRKSCDYTSVPGIATCVPLLRARQDLVQLCCAATLAEGVQPPALTCLAISMSRSQAGDDTSTGVVTS